MFLTCNTADGMTGGMLTKEA